MKKIVLILMFLLFPLSANAFYEVTNPNCTIELRNEISASVFEIIYSSEKQIEKDVVYYKLLINNIPEELSIKDIDTNIIYKDDFVIDKIAPGSTKIFQIYANSKTACEGLNAYTKTVVIQYYNKYSTSPLCDGNEEYMLCKENSKVSLSLEEFENLMNEYIKNKDKENPIEEETTVEKENFFEVILNFLYDNYITILIAIIISGTIGIVIILLVKRKKYNF